MGEENTWVKNWGEKVGEGDQFYTYVLEVNGQQFFCKDSSELGRGINFMYAEMTVPRPEGEIGEIRLIPVYTQSGLHEDEAIVLK